MINPLRFQCFMHVPYEGPGVIADWARQHRHTLRYTRFYEGDPLPDPGKLDVLVIMGGPMDVIDERATPWMAEEIAWIIEYLESGKPVLGICLGAQLVARALGATVYAGKEKEIGWYPLQFHPAPVAPGMWRPLPDTRKVFHWHGDTFTIPEGATLIASSNSFPHQGFIYRDNVIALQFHLEVTRSQVREMVENGRQELTSGPSVQSEWEILEETCCYSVNHELMFGLLDYLSGQVKIHDT